MTLTAAEFLQKPTINGTIRKVNISGTQSKLYLYGDISRLFNLRSNIDPEERLPKAIQFHDGVFTAGKLLLDGCSTRKIIEETKLHPTIVAKLHEALNLIIGKPLKCKCGMDSRHKQPCSAKSPK